MTNTTPGPDGSPESQNAEESNGSSSMLSGNANLDTSALHYHQEQLKMRDKERDELRKNETLFRQTPRFRAAQAAANNVRFEKNTIRDFLRQHPTKRPPGLKWWPPNIRVGRSDLCAPCRAIDFEAAFTTPRAFCNPKRRWIYAHEQHTHSFTQIERSPEGIDWPVNPGCQFCRYLANTARWSPAYGVYTLIFHNESQDHHDEMLIEIMHFSLRDANDFDLTFGHPNPRYFFYEMRSASNTIICHRNRPLRKAGTPQIVSTVFDGSLAQLWFDMCKREHKECGREDGVETPKTRLIDCLTRRLISTSSTHHPQFRFVALSYVWGNDLNNQAHTLTDDLSMDLPLTISDAITVTKALGFQYLWVDQYCIDQGDKEEIHRQIIQMDLIYKCADLTIIAAAGDSCDYGLPGVSACRRDVLEPFVLDNVFTFGVHPREDFRYWNKGSWHTRGWTFQEALLSRRMLIFSDTGMYYECNGHTFGAWQSEMLGGVECTDFRDSRPPYVHTGREGAGVESVVGSNVLSILVKGDRFPSEPVKHDGLLESYRTYIKLATEYTMRNLSHAIDGLNAFRGAANALQHFDHPVYSISGIPFIVPYQDEVEDSLANNSFLWGLAWKSSAGGTAPSPEFPSWSWGNMRVWNVTWIYYGYLDCEQVLAEEATYRAHSMRVELDLDGNKKLYALAEFARTCCNPTSFGPVKGNPTALFFKSRIFCSRFTLRCLDDGDGDGDDVPFFADCHSDLGYRYGGMWISLDNTSTDRQSDESGGVRHVPDSQPRCTTKMIDEALCEELESQSCSLVLLRFDTKEASVLLVEWLEDEPDRHQRTGRRVGIITINMSDVYGKRRENQNDNLLRCFSIEIDLRLI